MKKVIYTEKAPKPVGPYSQGILINNFLFIAGQVPIDPDTGKVVEGHFKDKVRRVLENIKAIVEAAGGDIRNIVKVTVYLKDISRYGEFNEVYSEFFRDWKPARAVVGVSNLPKDLDLEVEAIAYLE